MWCINATDHTFMPLISYCQKYQHDGRANS